MAWLASYDTLEDHPKLERLSELTGEQLEVCYYRLHCLWKKVLVYSPEGNLADVSDTQIARWARWPAKEASKFVQALKDCGKPNFQHGFLRDDRTLNDWDEYAGPWRNYLAKKKRDSDYQAKRRNESRDDSRTDNRNEVATIVVNTSSRVSTPTVSNRTEPNLIKPNQTDQHGPEGPGFAPGGIAQNAEQQQHAADAAQPSETAQAAAGIQPPGSGERSASAGSQAAGVHCDPAADGKRALGDARTSQQHSAGALARNTKAHSPAVSEVNRLAFDELGHALRSKGCAEADVRRLILHGVKEFPLCPRNCAMILLARWMLGEQKQRAGELKNDDPVAYAIGWGKNEDKSRRRSAPDVRLMREATELLNSAASSLAKNGAPHRQWMELEIWKPKAVTA